LSKSQISAAIATAVDFGLLFSMTEALHVWYVISVATGALIGAIVNFLLNRHWSFDAAHGLVGRQARRYAVVSAGSLLLNTAGTWALTEFGLIHYGISVVIASIGVGLLFNFPLHRGYVFR
jgi:putative flippase GtrA